MLLLFFEGSGSKITECSVLAEESELVSCGGLVDLDGELSGLESDGNSVLHHSSNSFLEI